MVRPISTTYLFTLVILSSLIDLAAACGGPGHEIIRRNPGGPVIEGTRGGRKRSNSNPCSGYVYAPTTGLASRYPSTTEIATILPSDTAARSLFASVDARVRSALPHTYPKGAANGDRTGVAYDGHADPDCWWPQSRCTSPASSTGLGADITTLPQPGSFGLTFDDGPHCGNAPLYDWMEHNDVRSTLFYIGGNVLNWPVQAIAGHDGGHEICIHTWSHHHMPALTNEQVFAELYYTQRVIKDVVGVTPKCWRPPYGDVDNRVRMIAEGLGLTLIGWSEDTSDWSLAAGASTSTIDRNYQGFIDNMRNGQYATYGPIVLAHEISTATINQAIKFLPSLKAAFSHLLPIATAYNISHPYVETDIVYPSFAEYTSGEEDATSSVSGSCSFCSTTLSASSHTGLIPTPSSTSASSSLSVSVPASSGTGASASAESAVSPSSGTSNYNAPPVSGGWRAVSRSWLGASLAICGAVALGM